MHNAHIKKYTEKKPKRLTCIQQVFCRNKIRSWCHVHEQGPTWGSAAPRRVETCRPRTTTTQSRRHGGGALVGLSPPNKAPSHTILKSEILYINGITLMSSHPCINIQLPPHKRKVPLLKTFWRRFCHYHHLPHLMVTSATHM